MPCPTQSLSLKAGALCPLGLWSVGHFEKP